MNILYIAHRIPYPPNKGDKIRAFHQIRYLAENHRVFVCALVDEPDDFRYRESLARYCRQLYLAPLRPIPKKILSLRGLITGMSMSALYFYEQRLQQQIDRILQRRHIDAVFCFSGTSSLYVFRSRFLMSGQDTAKASARPKLIMDFCDVDSVKWQEYAARSTFPFSLLYRREARMLACLERRTCAAFDHLVVISEAEKKLLDPFFPGKNRAVIVPNGVDLNYFRSAGPPPEHPRPVLLFTGAMDYQANVDGVLWFADKILPPLSKRFPDLCFIIAGRNPAPPIKQLDKKNNITVTGEVNDMRDWYNRADCCVVPLRIARGIQNKILEAMAMTRPVVTTTAALRGIPAAPGRDLLIADEPHDFSLAVTQLLDNGDLRRTTALNGRKFIEQSCSWSTHLSRLDQLLKCHNYVNYHGARACKNG